MSFKKFLNQFNILAQCKKYDIPLWQCPQLLFLVMGIIIIVSNVSIYALGTHYINDPEIVALVVLLLTAVLFIIAFIITQSFEKLAEVSRMKTEFINIVSHQLRGPVTNLKWSIELLMSGRVDGIKEKHSEYFRILKENSDRMQELVNDLLIISRLEQGRLPINKQKFLLDDLINKTISEFSSFIKASNTSVSFKKAKKSFPVYTDPYQLRIVIENLLENAIRYGARKGKIDIYLGFKNKDIYFEIKDNGIGIPKEDQKYIFQKFFRSKNVLKYQTRGSGLGLFITKSIIKRLGGKIGFTSKEGQGTTFWFTLPITH